VPIKLHTELFRYKDLDIIRPSWCIYLTFLNIIRILSNSYFIEFYTKDEAIELELERTRFTTIISNKYFKIVSLIDLKSVPIKGYKLLVALS
jgi:hypothetical protein